MEDDVGYVDSLFLIWKTSTYNKEEKKKNEDFSFVMEVKTYKSIFNIFNTRHKLVVDSHSFVDHIR